MTRPTHEPDGSPTIERFDMRANFEGLIQLLARNLYPDPDVFIRELIQNAHDSVRRRRKVEPGHEGRIEVEIRRETSTIVFRDDGIGMDRADIHDFLSVIGSTGTGAARAALEDAESSDALELVGQFGIGMLSAFVVAERVTVTTRKLGSDDAFVWVNEGRTECSLARADRDAAGSEIEVLVGRDHAYMLDPRKVRDAIVRYCDLLQLPIYLNGQGPVNCLEAPWDRPGWSSADARTEAYRSFLRRRSPDTALEVIPIEFEEPVRARGALYISDRRIPGFSNTGVVDLFVRRMFVRGNDEELLPEWAKFIRGVIECPDLQPTAARDNVQRTGWAYTALRQRLGEVIVERLVELAEHRPDRFREINRWHHYHLKGMAYLHEDFLDKVGGLLLYETNRGLMPLSDLFEANYPVPGAEAQDEPWRRGDDTWRGAEGASTDPEWIERERASLSPVYFFSDGGSQPQFYSMADARGWVVASTSQVFDEQLLVRFARSRGAEGRLRRLDGHAASVLFRPPPTELVDRASALETRLEKAFRSCGLEHVRPRVGAFEPVSLPTMVLLSPESEAELELEALVQQPLFMESFRGVAEEVLDRKERRPVDCHVNVGNPLVRSMMERSDLPGSALVGLYVCAAVNARGLITPKTVGSLHGQLVDLIRHVVGGSPDIGGWGDTE